MYIAVCLHNYMCIYLQSADYCRSSKKVISLDVFLSQTGGGSIKNCIKSCSFLFLRPRKFQFFFVLHKRFNMVLSKKLLWLLSIFFPLLQIAICSDRSNELSPGARSHVNPSDFNKSVPTRKEATGKNCIFDPDYDGTRVCSVATSFFTSKYDACDFSPSASTCISFEKLSSSSFLSCLNGSRCFKTNLGNFCSRSKYSDADFKPVDDGNGGNGGEWVCIPMDALERYDTPSLIFDVQKRASVFCDWHENCATAGHMVVYKGVTMSMSSCCKLKAIFCVRRVKLVNNPKMN